MTDKQSLKQLAADIAKLVPKHGDETGNPVHCDIPAIVEYIHGRGSEEYVRRCVEEIVSDIDLSPVSLLCEVLKQMRSVGRRRAMRKRVACHRTNCSPPDRA